MSPSGDKRVGLVADANVLIDYIESDKTVLALMSRHLAPIHVPSPVFDDEVRKLSAKDAQALSIDVMEPTLDQVLEARAAQGATSWYDRLCLMVARDAGWSVLTNDIALRRACDGTKVSCVWGLEAMTILVGTKHLSAARAVGVAEKIARANPFITRRIVQRFRDDIAL